MKTPALTLVRATALLKYDLDTGIFTWRNSQGKAKRGDEVGTIQAGYRKATIDKEQIKLHRLAWFMSYGTWPAGQIDHIDGDKLNNRIANLRDVSMSVNMQNRNKIKRKRSDLPYGVTQHAKGGRYMANIRIGTYDTVEEAEAAFLHAKRLIHEGCTS